MPDTIEAFSPRRPSPGRYDDMMIEEYLATEAMGQEFAKNIVERAPRYAWFHSAFNPAFSPTVDRKLEFGSAIHLALLEPEELDRRIAVIDAPDYKTKKAQEARDAAYAAGKTPVLVGQLAMLRDIRAAVAEHDIGRDLFAAGQAESSFFWRDPESGILCRTRPDFTRDKLDYLVEVKSCANAHPAAVSALLWNAKYFIKAGWTMEGVEAVTGKRPKEYRMLFIEQDPPHLVSVFRVDERVIEWGALVARRARHVFRRCVARDEAPGYRRPDQPDRDAIFDLELPSFAEFKLQERHEAGEFATKPASPEELRRAAEFFAPF